MGELTPSPRTQREAERLRKCLQDPLDSIEVRHGDIRATFRSHGGDVWGTVSFLIEEGIALSGSSTCLPARGWAEVARAYARAVQFMECAGLSDGGDNV